jgi:predicted kinase
MPPAPLLVVTGPPGAGKTTVSRLLAARFEPRVCVLESDWWWTTIVKGHVPPWLDAAQEQNRTVVRSFTAAAGVMAAGGYPTIVDGIVGPWMLDLVRAEAAASAVPLNYVVLRPALHVSLDRGGARTGDERVPGHPALTDEGPIRQLWQAFATLGALELHALDNTDLDATQTADRVWSLLAQGALLLAP